MNRLDIRKPVALSRPGWENRPLLVHTGWFLTESMRSFSVNFECETERRTFIFYLCHFLRSRKTVLRKENLSMVKFSLYPTSQNCNTCPCLNQSLGRRMDHFNWLWVLVVDPSKESISPKTCGCEKGGIWEWNQSVSKEKEGYGFCTENHHHLMNSLNSLEFRQEMVLFSINHCLKNILWSLYFWSLNNISGIVHSQVQCKMSILCPVQHFLHLFSPKYLSPALTEQLQQRKRVG